MRNSIKNRAAALLWLAASSLPLYAQDVSADTLSEEPLSLPFVEYFDKEESLANWTIRDSAGNILEDAELAMTWNDAGGVGGTPYLLCQPGGYLIFSPMNMAIGKAYLSLFSRHDVRILYGSSPVPQDMAILQEINYEDSEFRHILCQFEASGEPLYFAFSSASNMQGIFIDAIEIGQGEYKPHPRCRILEMETPASGYDLDLIDFSVTIANEGTAPAYGKDMTLLYNVNERVHRSIPLNQDTIPSNGNSLIELLDIAMLPGRNKISVQLEGTDSIYSGIVYNNQPLYPPHQINLERGEMYAGSREAWGHEYELGSFIAEDNFESYPEVEASVIRSAGPVDFPFISIPFQLEKDVEYKIGFEYQGGFYAGRIGYGNIQLVNGLQGNDYGTWNTLWHDSAIYTFDWTEKEVSFSVPESGLYSFGFWNHGFMMCLQNIKIEKADNNIRYDIALSTDSPALPLSSCDLDYVEVAARVDNWGDDTIHGFDATYIVNEIDTIEEYIYMKINPKNYNGPTFTFNELAKLEKGKNVITVSVDMCNDTNIKNNCYGSNAYSVIYNHLPKQTPHMIDFEKEEMGIGPDMYWREWYLNKDYNGEWILRGLASYPISSTCFEMQADKTYRLNFEYSGGFMNPVHQDPVDFYVSIYNTADGIEKAQEIWRGENILNYDMQNAEIVFEIEKDGFYSIVIGLPHYNRHGVEIKNIHLSEIIDYDLRTDLLTDIPYYFPKEQIHDYPLLLTIENRGMQSANSVTDVFLNDFGSGHISESILPNEKKNISIQLKINNLNFGDTMNFTSKTVIEGHEDEDINPDHEINSMFMITDTNMCYFNAEKTLSFNFSISSCEVYGVQGVALPFIFSKRDTLTSVSIGWGTVNANMPLPSCQLSVFPFDIVHQKIVGKAIYQTEITRPRDSGWVVYDIPDMLVSTPLLICIDQLQMDLGVLMDLSPNGFWYKHLVSDSLIIENTMGYPAIALNLGHDGVLDLKQDVEMLAFTNPSANTGAFAANEPVTVRVKNNSADSVDVPVHLLINNQEAGSTTLRIAPYVSGNAVIEADLSQPNTQYDICVFADMENDEDRSNDTLRMSLATVPAMDPYVMDFEYTPDFAISDFQPEWTTLDNDGMPTYGWQYVSFPHTFEAFGFISFNPSSTTPPIIEEFELESIQGRRFGASFSTNANNADDWLISPKLQMPPSGSKISFWVKSFTKDYGYDQYRVLVSTTTNALESFEAVTDFREAPDWDWKQEVVDLSAYNGKEIHIAIQRYQGEQGYGFVFMIDDIRVDKTGTGTESDASILDASLYPNPAQEKVTIFCDAGIQEVEIIDMNGRVLFAKQGLNQDTFVYNVESLSPGLYFAKVRSSQGLQVLKFTVIE